jgi:hypothetical protein
LGVVKSSMSERNVRVRPLGGGFGCLGMILVSVVLSIIATVVLNVLLRAF